MRKRQERERDRESFVHLSPSYFSDTWEAQDSIWASHMGRVLQILESSAAACQSMHRQEAGLTCGAGPSIQALCETRDAGVSRDIVMAVAF